MTERPFFPPENPKKILIGIQSQIIEIDQILLSGLEPGQIPDAQAVPWQELQKTLAEQCNCNPKDIKWVKYKASQT